MKRLLIAIGLAIAPSLAAETATAQTPARPVSTEGEVPAWLYPREGRRNPMRPPAALYEMSSRAVLQVRAIMENPRDPKASTAIVVLQGRAPIRAIVRAGDRIGDYRILKIESDRVLATLHVMGADRAVVAPVSRDSTARN